MTHSTGPVVLVGPMGVGKTTLGKKLAHALNIPFIDTDAEIVAKHGEIVSIFENEGEPVFRKYETEVLAQSLKQAAIIATGGGIVLSDMNQQLLRNHTVIYLSTDGRHMKQRLANAKRPLLKNGFADWQQIYDKRKPLYEKIASYTVDTSNLPLKAIVSKLEDLIA